MRDILDCIKAMNARRRILTSQERDIIFQFDCINQMIDINLTRIKERTLQMVAKGITASDTLTKSAPCCATYSHQLLARAHAAGPPANELPYMSPGFQRIQTMHTRARQSPPTTTSARGAQRAFWKRGHIHSQVVALLTAGRDGSDPATYTEAFRAYPSRATSSVLYTTGHYPTIVYGAKDSSIRLTHVYEHTRRF